MTNQERIDFLCEDALRLVHGSDVCYGRDIIPHQMESDFLVPAHGLEGHAEPTGFIAKGVMRLEDMNRLVSLQDNKAEKLRMLYAYKERLLRLADNGQNVSVYVTAVRDRIHRIEKNGQTL